MKRGILATPDGDCLRVPCPRCAQGELLIHSEKMFWFCYGSAHHCWAAGEGEKALDALFDEKK